MSPGFPLLRTPQTVQTLIFNELDNYEAASVAMCSKKAYQHVKLCRSKLNNWTIDVMRNYIILKPPKTDSSENRFIFERWIGPLATIQEHPICSSPKTEIVDFNGYKVPVLFCQMTKFRTFWNDEIIGLKTVTDYICGLFKMEIHRVFIEKSSIWMIDWLNSRQESYAMTEINWLHGPALTDDEYRHILTNCRATNQLKLNASAQKDFVFNGNFPKAEIFIISPSRWVTVDNLKAMDSTNIHLGFSELTSSDMNLFLKHWLTGGNPRLSYMNIGMKTISHEDIFFELEEKVVSKKRTFGLLIDGIYENFEDSYDIERNDGAKASVLLSELQNGGNMCIVVWPVTK